MCAPSIRTMHATELQREMDKRRFWDHHFELDDLLRTLSYRMTDAEYGTFALSIRGKLTPLAIEAAKQRLEELKAGTPEILVARDALEKACINVDKARAIFGDGSYEDAMAVGQLLVADAALESLVNHG